jgi:Spy/CpxP family protein refolding chaperone
MNEHETQDAPMPPVLQRVWLRNLFLGLAILLCGMVIGSVMTAVMLLQEAPVRPEGWRPERMPERIAGEMREKYGLTEEQEAQLQTVFESHWKILSEIRAEVEPRVEAEHEALRKGVEAVLTPEQAAKWREEFEKMRSRWRPRGGGMPPSSAGGHWRQRGGGIPPSSPNERP